MYRGIAASFCMIYLSVCCVDNGPLVRYVKLRVAHAPGMPGTFSLISRVSDPDMHHGTCVTHVPWCMPGSLTSVFLWSRWRGKRSCHTRRMRNLQFFVSGKRPMFCVHQLTCYIVVHNGTVVVVQSMVCRTVWKCHCYNYWHNPQGVASTHFLSMKTNFLMAKTMNLGCQCPNRKLESVSCLLGLTFPSVRPPCTIELRSLQNNWAWENVAATNGKNFYTVILKFLSISTELSTDTIENRTLLK